MLRLVPLILLLCAAPSLSLAQSRQDGPEPGQSPVLV